MGKPAAKPGQGILSPANGVIRTSMPGAVDRLGGLFFRLILIAGLEAAAQAQPADRPSVPPQLPLDLPGALSSSSGPPRIGFESYGGAEVCLGRNRRRQIVATQGFKR